MRVCALKYVALFILRVEIVEEIFLRNFLRRREDIAINIFF